MKNKLIKKAKENDIILEINESHVNKTEIDILNDKVKNFQICNIKSYLIKAIKNNKCVKLVTQNITDIDNIINNINTIYDIQDNINSNRLSKGIIINKKETREVVDYNLVQKELLSLNELKRDYPWLKTIEVGYAHIYEGNYINNLNSNMADECEYHELVFNLTSEQNNECKNVYGSLMSKCFDFTEIKQLVLNKLKELEIKLESDSVKTNRYNIILKNDCVNSILGSFITMFDAKSIELKESVLMDKYKSKVFSEKINIVEDPASGMALVPRLFDSEGTKTYYKELIKDGVFVKKINNIEYALKTNEEPTGNAYGVNNLYIKEGNNSFNDLLNKLNNGIIIDSVIGLHSGIDIKSGNISLQAEGILVENGKLIKGLSMIILSTNIFELFNNVIEIGNDMSKDNESINSPSLLIKDIVITGKK